MQRYRHDWPNPVALLVVATALALLMLLCWAGNAIWSAVHG